MKQYFVKTALDVSPSFEVLCCALCYMKLPFFETTFVIAGAHSENKIHRNHHKRNSHNMILKTSAPNSSLQRVWSSDSKAFDYTISGSIRYILHRPKATASHNTDKVDDQQCGWRDRKKCPHEWVLLGLAISTLGTPAGAGWGLVSRLWINQKTSMLWPVVLISGK